MLPELSDGGKKALKAALKIIEEEKSPGHYIQDKSGKIALEMCPDLLSELSKGISNNGPLDLFYSCRKRDRIFYRGQMKK